MAKPDFLVIGAQKAGTTWLDEMFKSHEAIWTPPVKELQFFNEYFHSERFHWADNHRKKHAEANLRWLLEKNQFDWKEAEINIKIANSPINFEWYEQIFDYSPPEKIKGEMTPEYSLLDQDDINKIIEWHPNIKCILLLRKPSDRAISHIKMRLLQEGFETDYCQAEYDEFVTLAAKEHDVIQRGNYKYIIDLWSKHLPKDNLLVLLSEEVKTIPSKILETIGNFLDIDIGGFKANPDKRVHVGKNYTLSEKAIESILSSQIENDNWYEENKHLFSHNK